MPPYLRITRSTPLSGDTRFLGPRVAVRSHGDNYVSKAAINSSISVYIRRSETLLKPSYLTGPRTDFTTLTCVICHTGPVGCFPAVLPPLCRVNRYKTSYRSVFDVIRRKIETDGTGVTMLVGAFRHAVLTHSRGSDGFHIYAHIRQDYREEPNTVIYKSAIDVYSLVQLVPFGPSRLSPTRRRPRPSPARLPDL